MWELLRELITMSLVLKYILEIHVHLKRCNPGELYLASDLRASWYLRF